MRVLTERISYLPATSQPLSADIGLIHGDRYDWIYDVGNCETAAEVIKGMNRERNIILSHFHVDHAGNLGLIPYRELYCGGFTKTKLQKGIAVRTPISFDDGLKLTVFPIPSTHSKGAVGLEVNEEYAFLGDAIYAAAKNGKRVYNVSLLKETIDVLKGLKARWFLISHDAAYVRSKNDVLAELCKLYAMRKPGEAYMVLNNKDR